jgi:hypothetical protein
MKITGFSVVGRDDGREVTISFLVANNEELEDSDILRAYGVACEVGAPNGSGSRDPKEPAEPAQAPAATASSGGRRGRNYAPVADAASSSTAASPSSGGRRRGTSDPSSTPTPATSAGSRRSASPGAETSGGSAAGASPTAINDADLSKACSHAALALGPDGVKSVLSRFKVQISNQLGAQDRHAFLAALTEETAKVDAQAQAPAPAGRRGRR